MQLDVNVYAVILLVLGVAAGFLSLFIIYRLSEVVRWFAFTLFNGAIWSFFYGFELASLDLPTIYFWIKFEYFGIVLLPFTWIMFCVRYTGRDNWLQNKLFPWLFLLISVAVYVAVLTNDLHHLYYRSVSLEMDAPFPVIALEKGLLHYLFTFYFYSIILWGNYLLISNTRNAAPLFKSQTFLLVMSTAIPLMFHISDFIGWEILGPINVTPFAFTVSFFATGLGLVKFNLFDLIPIAKDQLIAAITDGLVVIDPKDQIIEINPAMSKILGREVSTCIGRSLVDILGHQKTLLNTTKEQKHNKITISEGEGLTKRIFLTEIIPLKGRKDRFKGILLLFTDITEERNNQNLLEMQAKELKKHNALKDKLFSIVSHDLKGPVLGVKEILDLSKSGYMTPDEFTEILPALSNSVDGVAMLLENLLAWSRSQLKGEFMDKTVFDIYPLIQRQKAWLEPVATLKQIQVDIDSEGSIMVVADKHMVELVIRNLLNNAVKFCSYGDRVSVHVINQKEDVKISVKDTGAGISQDNLERLRRGDSFTTFGSNNESGTGLGLLLVRDYVQKNGGTLRIESQENEGSEFSFVLPKINVN